MRKLLVFFIVFGLIVGGFAYFSSAEELSSIKIRKIEKAVEKLESKERGPQSKGYREVKDFGPVTIPFLIKSLEDKTVNFESRISICKLLGIFKANEAVPVLIYTLKNGDFSVRAGVCRALEAIGNPVSIDPLLGMLNDNAPDVRRDAVRALDVLDDPRIPVAVQDLLKDDDEEVSIAAVTLLDNKLDPATANALREALEDKSASVRMIAARALGGLKDAESVDKLVWLITEDPSQSVRMDCAIALGKIGDVKALPGLIEAVNDDYKDVQVRAASSLKDITGQDFGRNYEEWKNWEKEQQ